MSIWKRTTSTIGWVLGVQRAKDQVSYLRQDLSHLKDDLKFIKDIYQPQKGHMDQWNEYIQIHQISEKSLRRQYRLRQGLSVLLFFLMLVDLVFIVVYGHYSVGIGTLILCGVIFFKNSFRLFQIRHHSLCAIKEFLKVVKIQFKELLPLSLPDSWVSFPQKSQSLENEGRVV